MSFEDEARAKEMNRLHEQVNAQIKKVNEQYKLKANKNCTHLKLQLGDLA